MILLLKAKHVSKCFYDNMIKVFLCLNIEVILDAGREFFSTK